VSNSLYEISNVISFESNQEERKARAAHLISQFTSNYENEKSTNDSKKQTSVKFINARRTEHEKSQQQKRKDDDVKKEQNFIDAN
jgi:hypothetical protein